MQDVIKAKLNSKIERGANSAQTAIARLVEEGKIARDFIAPLGVNLRAQQRDPVITFTANGTVKMNVREDQFTLHPNATYQVAERVGTNPSYIKNLVEGNKEWQRQLAAHILNEHTLNTERSRVLVRAVGEQVRGVLSDSYRRLNSVDILTSFAEEATRQQGIISDGYMDDTRIWLEAILPVLFDVKDTKNGTITVFFGASLSTSDYGSGALDLRTSIYQGVCLNGMVRESTMRQVHLGSRLPDDLRLSDRTYELDTRTTSSAIRDLTKGILGKDNLLRRMNEINRAANQDVDITKELKQLVSRGALRKNEEKEITELIVRNSPEDGVAGEATLWKLTQAITAQARTAEPRRMRELMEIGGTLMERI